LAKAGRYDEANKVFDEALDIARKIKNDFWKSETLTSIASELAKAGRYDEA
ncbi:MAG TPA: tetratricopeptide repeat protein, partial [Thermoplasmata archaeon]|nr:tetratricopeptide repeat protein [Thermoplasmata archaeon]